MYNMPKVRRTIWTREAYECRQNIYFSKKNEFRTPQFEFSNVLSIFLHIQKFQPKAFRRYRKINFVAPTFVPQNGVRKLEVSKIMQFLTIFTAVVRIVGPCHVTICISMESPYQSASIDPLTLIVHL